MPNALYRQLPNGDWLRQDAGGPAYFKVAQDAHDQLWYPSFSYDLNSWVNFIPATGGFNTANAAQVALNNYVQQLNAGTA
jgi:hypothetical protein